MISERDVVLVVEDELPIREIVQVVLGEVLGVRVVVAADGMEALDRIAEGHPSLVVTDIGLPRLSGLGLIRQLKVTPSTSAIPVIALSAVASNLAEALAAGADDVLSKPFDLDRLTEMVGNQLGWTKGRWPASRRDVHRQAAQV